MYVARWTFILECVVRGFDKVWLRELHDLGVAFDDNLSLDTKHEFWVAYLDLETVKFKDYFFYTFWSKF